MTAAEGEAEQAKLDPEALARLARQGGNALIGELLASFETRTPRRLAQALAALAAERHEDVIRIFHTLKSSAGLVGATELRNHAAAAEDAARERRTEDVKRLAGRVEACYQKLLPELSSHGTQRLPRIALVEDNEDNRMLMRVLLETQFDVKEYGDGTSALEGVRRDPPELVLLDISLPGMDGLEVLHALRAEERFAELPVIAVTAHAMEGDRKRLIGSGFDDYVSKPILDEADLISRIRRALARGPAEAGA